VFKKALPNWQRGNQVSDAVYIDEAQGWSKKLTMLRTRGPGDLENAMRAIESEYGIEYGVLWSLRYRRDRIKTISVSVYERLKAAYQAERERQYRMLKHELGQTEAVTGPSDAAVAAAKVVVRTAEETP
jgi:hypothetical protein